MRLSCLPASFEADSGIYLDRDNQIVGELIESELALLFFCNILCGLFLLLNCRIKLLFHRVFLISEFVHQLGAICLASFFKQLYCVPSNYLLYLSVN